MLNKRSTHTADESVFTVVLMNCCYLLEQHLHLLTAEGDKRSKFKHHKPMSRPEAEASPDLLPFVVGQSLC